MADDAFVLLMQRIRHGDASAAVELVRAYEPAVQRYIRLRLTDPKLRRLLDSVDICQSVLGNFFVRAAAGQFELDEPAQLLQLLYEMAHNRLRNHVRDQHAARRDVRRLQEGSELVETIAAPQESPSAAVAGEELLQRARALLTEEERRLAEQRAEGRRWEEIAQALGADPDVLRKRLARALDRITRQLGLEEPADE